MIKAVAKRREYLYVLIINSALQDVQFSYYRQAFICHTPTVAMKVWP